MAISKAPSEQIKEDFQATVDSAWAVSSSLYTIQEELTFGTQVFTDTEVRVNHAIDTVAGEKLGDDYRVFIFKDFDHAKGLGYRYQFNNNIWLCTNSDLYKYVTASTTVRRCNNVLKFRDSYGAIKTEPCIIDYEYSGTSPLYDNAINIPSGNLVVVAQYNQNTKDIKINDRFLFGTQAYKVKSIKDFQRNATFDNNTTPLVYYTLYKDSESVYDDFVNGIASSSVVYTMSTNIDNITQVTGFTSKIIPTLKRNGKIVASPDILYDDGYFYDTGLLYSDIFVWYSSNPLVATVDNDGNVTLVGNGTAYIRVYMYNNSTVSADVQINVQSVPTPTNEIVISPNVTEIMQSKTQTYEVYKYLNNVKQLDTFTLVGSGANANNYTLTQIDGNHFSVKNIKYTSTPLVITATSGTDTYTFTIKLRGMF